MVHKNIVILGGGIAGLSAAYMLSKHNMDCTVYEKNSTYGGLCNSFVINGFTFDIFSHTAFSQNPYVNSMLEEKTSCFTHMPEAVNYYNGLWVRNPVQNNLIDLPVEERIKVIKDFISRPSRNIQNYEDWLLNQYGYYFTDHFPSLYTRKYWTVESKELEAKWVEGRMYVPSIEEVLLGAMKNNTPNVHYTKINQYPKKGGFAAFLKPFVTDYSIQLNKKVTFINPIKKVIQFMDGEKISYNHLISTIPLDILINSMNNVPDNIRNITKHLDYTSGFIISLGMKGKNKMPTRWFYVYDEDIYPARVYSPNLQSTNNVPEGCYALQAEIYYSKYKPLEKEPDILMEEVIEQLSYLKVLDKEEIIVKDVKNIPYANIMFTPEIYQARDKIHSYLDQFGILYAGRFGEWDYLWVDQSILSGKRVAEKIIKL